MPPGMYVIDNTRFGIEMEAQAKVTERCKHPGHTPDVILFPCEVRAIFLFIIANLYQLLSQRTHRGELIQVDEAR